LLWCIGVHGLGGMPIHRLLRNGQIKPQDLQRLDRAFTFTLKSLHLVDRDDPICEIIARKVFEIDAAGTHEPKEIAKMAVKEFGILN
jgi:hypothetical protein